MGVPGLLKALADIHRPVHVSTYKGLRVGIDAYCFLHRGKLGCAEALLATPAQASQLKHSHQDALFRPILEVVAYLRSVGAEPLLVFDGGPLPAKQATEQARRQARETARWRAASAVAVPNAPAAKLLSGAVDITPDMAALCIRKMQKLGVECWVAPCEADAQLAYFALSGRLDVVVSEDVDLLAFGCPRVLFGLDVRSGNGREVRLEDLSKCRGLAPYRLAAETLPDLCVFGGCDYLPSLPRMGLRTAAQLLHRSGGHVRRALQLARREGIVVSEEYYRQFAEARLVFSSQAVFNDVKGCLQPLRPFPAEKDGSSHRELLGLSLTDASAADIALARVNPFTLEPFDEPVQEPAPAAQEPAPVQLLPSPARAKAELQVAEADVPDSTRICVSQGFRRPRPCQPCERPSADESPAPPVTVKRRKLGCRII